jgi:hypothetical protein
MKRWKKLKHSRDVLPHIIKKKITTYKQYIHRRINTIVKQDSQIAHAYIEIIHKL